MAEEKLATFRRQFEEDGERFAEVTRKDCTVLETTLANRAEQEKLISEIISMQADEVLSSYETDDAGRHWKTRRSGYWGYMHELQTRVANKIFPKVAEELNKQSDAFSDFVQNFRAHLNQLSVDSGTTITQLEIGNELQLDVGGSLNAFLEETLSSLQEMVEGEETRIIGLLEEFVDKRVEDKITEARERVTGILGRGTTISQTAEVRSFYRDVRSILKDALRHHVENRFKGFATHLTAQAKAIPDKALSQVVAEIDRASTDIRAAAEAAIAGQKEAFERAAAVLTDEISVPQEMLAKLLEDVPDEIDSKLEVPIERKLVPTIDETDYSSATIQARATHFVTRHILKHGTKGWHFARIFSSEHLRGTSEAWLIDPYLALPHQRRNLTEFIMVLLQSAKPKTLHIITREVSEIPPDADKAFFSSLDRDAFEKAGMRIECSIDEGIHDRSVVLNNGFVFKLGRGLDIFKSASGLASRDPSLRQVRECEIHVFSAPQL